MLSGEFLTVFVMEKTFQKLFYIHFYDFFGWIFFFDTRESLTNFVIFKDYHTFRIILQFFIFEKHLKSLFKFIFTIFLTLKKIVKVCLD